MASDLIPAKQGEQAWISLYRQVQSNCPMVVQIPTTTKYLTSRQRTPSVVHSWKRPSIEPSARGNAQISRLDGEDKDSFSTTVLWISPEILHHTVWITFHTLLKWEMIILPTSHYLTHTVLFIRLGGFFEVGNEKVNWTATCANVLMCRAGE